MCIRMLVPELRRRHDVDPKDNNDRGRRDDYLASYGRHIRPSRPQGRRGNNRAGANRLLDAGGIDFAVLDYHVTDGDTDPLMLRLHEMGVQFLVCSGLPARDDAETLFGDAPVLSKPFSTEGLLEAITALMGVRQSDDLQ